jgi:hypothetical protein
MWSLSRKLDEPSWSVNAIIRTAWRRTAHKPNPAQAEVPICQAARLIQSSDLAWQCRRVVAHQLCEILVGESTQVGGCGQWTDLDAIATHSGFPA